MIAPNVRGKKPLHPSRQVACAMRPKNQVKMIRHQAIGKDPHRATSLSIAEEFLEGDIILLFMEDLVPRVPPIDHMINDASRRGPGCSWHSQSIHKDPDPVKGKVECPRFPPRSTSPEQDRQARWSTRCSDRYGFRLGYCRLWNQHLGELSHMSRTLTLSSTDDCHASSG
jgi:hypothetical protein